MTLRLDKDGKIARLVIDRPDKRNAFNQEMWDFFPTLLADAMADDAVRVLMVHASERGSAFCAGADIAEFGAGAQDPTWRATNQASINKLQHELARAPKPTIAISRSFLRNRTDKPNNPKISEVLNGLKLANLQKHKATFLVFFQVKTVSRVRVASLRAPTTTKANGNLESTHSLGAGYFKSS